MRRTGGLNVGHERPTGRSTANLLPPLSEAKLAAPRQRAETLSRPRILRALDADGPELTLVSAPPGYGKTTAVRSWCHERQTPLAWVTVDDGDNDPVRLWTYVATAIDRVREGLGRGALQRLRMPGTTSESAVDELTNGMAAWDGDLVVVIDDLQSVTDQHCLESIDRFVRRLPPNARLVVITRVDPALRLANLRGHAELAELRATELAFTAAEAQELLVDRGRLALGPSEIELLTERTEGWPAALVLAALWLRNVDDPRRAVHEFGGGQHFVADYLSQEVLGSLDDATRSFLLRASVLGRFTAELCDGVFDRTDSASVLDELDASNLFVIRLEHGKWFRIHSLLAEFAGFELATVEPDAARDIHRRASRWFRARDMPVEAVEHAAKAGDEEVVAQILAEHHLALLRSGGTTLLRWARKLSDETLVAYPELAVDAATSAMCLGGHNLERRRLLQLAERTRTERPERFTAYVDAVAKMVRAASIDDDLPRAVAAGRRAVEIAEEGSDDALVAALAAYARALYFAGRLDEAWATALRAIEHPDIERRAPAHADARSTLALIAVDRERLASARTHAEKAKSIGGGNGFSRTWLGANASAALGAVLLAEGNLAEAERELTYAEHLSRDEVASVQHAWLLVMLARIRCRRGRLDDAEATLRLAREAVDELSDSGGISALADEVEVELQLATRRADGGEILEPPSQAELAVLRLLASELSAREIGRELFLSQNTVRSHTRAIYRKLGVGSRADAVARAGALGLLGETDPVP